MIDDGIVSSPLATWPSAGEWPASRRRRTTKGAASPSLPHQEGAAHPPRPRRPRASFATMAAASAPGAGATATPAPHPGCAVSCGSWSSVPGCPLALSRLRHVDCAAAGPLPPRQSSDNTILVNIRNLHRTRVRTRVLNNYLEHLKNTHTCARAGKGMAKKAKTLFLTKTRPRQLNMG
jgi:hypothetical protein